ncbi:MAG: penicillin acylase family protein [Actinobacteria bacterium]|nr:penicillin acylase family protein [Actinomycetota bacterium]
MRLRVGGIAASAAVVVLVATATGHAADPTAVTIYRDQYGVPQIEAGSADALAYGTGYEQAKERPFITNGIRLFAQGRISELEGKDVLPADEVMRRDFYNPAEVQRQYDQLPDPMKRALQAFSDGFNKGMQEVMLDPTRRPALFDALGYTPEPWKPTDSISVLMLFTEVEFAGEGGAGQLGNAALLGHLQKRYGNRRGLAMWNDLLFKNDPRAPTVGGGQANRAPRSILHERLPSAAQQKLARAYASPLQSIAQARDAQAASLRAIIKRLPLPKIGSYGAAISGRRTRSGGAVVLGSPQAGLGAPSIFWQLGQHAPGWNCTGFTVPGVGPWTGIGWCNDHAWTLIAGNIGEQVDNYIERINPSNPRLYLYRGNWRQMTQRTETFHVAKCAPPICKEVAPPSTEQVTFDYTVHGPVVARDTKHGIAITQRRAQRGIWGRTLQALAEWNTSSGFSGFDAAADLATGSYNMLYGDRTGRIMYRFTGVQPIRAAGIDRRLPSPGTGGAEWRGLLHGHAMPRVVNPRSDVLSANQGIETKPVPWWPNSSAVAVGQVSRVRENRRLLVRLRNVDTSVMKAVNPQLIQSRDPITPVFAGYLRRALAHAHDKRLRQAWRLFRRWAAAGYPRVDANHDRRFDSPALEIFGADDTSYGDLPDSAYPRTLWHQLLRRVFGDELAGAQMPGTWLGQLSMLKIALDGRIGHRRLARDYLDNIRTHRHHTATSLIRASLRKALSVLQARFGTSDMSKWLGPVPHHDFSAQGAVGAPGFDGFDHGTYSQIVDPHAGVGLYILPPGNGEVDGAAETALAEAGTYPKHYTDQTPLYARFDYLVMPHFASQYRANPESVASLTYTGP